MKRAKYAWSGIGLWALLAMPSPSSAQEDDARRPVVELPEIHVEGRYHKPNAFYILPRSGVGYEIVDLRTHFVREVIRTARDEPFRAR